MADASILPPATPVARPVPKTAARPRDREHTIRQQPAFVLHSYPYKETSLIVEVLTRDYGRMSMVAKGAKRPASRLRGMLQTFQPVLLDWSGKAELRNLHSAEWVAGMPPLEKEGLLFGYYVNELILKFIARDDAHPGLFQHYVTTITSLAQQHDAQIVLRKFELALLKNCGIIGNLARCLSPLGAIDAQRDYYVDPSCGPVAVPPDASSAPTFKAGYADNGPAQHQPLQQTQSSSHPWPRVAGKTLLDMEQDRYDDASTLQQSRTLMRYLVAYHLDGTPLQTRQILIDLRQL